MLSAGIHTSGIYLPTVLLCEGLKYHNYQDSKDYR